MIFQKYWIWERRGIGIIMDYWLLIFTWHLMVNQGLSPGGREVESLGFNGSSGQAICMEFSHNFQEIHGILARLTGYTG